MRGFGIAVVAGLVPACGVLAGPPNRDHIDAGATWMAHLDLEQAAETELGRWFIEGFLDAEEWHVHASEEDIAWIREMTDGLDIEFGEDFHGMTVYGSGEPEGESTVILWYGNSKLERWQEYLEERADGLTKEIRVGRKVYDALYLPELDEYETMLELDDDEVVWLTSWDTDMMAHAIGVIEGHGDSLPRSSPLLSRPGLPHGAIAYVAAIDLQSLERFEPASQVARQADGFWAAVGQDDDDAYIDLNVSAGSEEDAESIVEVFRGLLALGRLIASDDPDLRPLLEFAKSIEFHAEGKILKASLRHDVHAIQSFLEEHEDDWDDWEGEHD